MWVTHEQKAVALAALYNAASPLGMGWVHYDSKPMTVEEASELLKRTMVFDCLKGRPLKMDFRSNTLDFSLYNRDNGDGESVVLEALTN